MMYNKRNDKMKRFFEKSQALVHGLNSSFFHNVPILGGLINMRKGIDAKMDELKSGILSVKIDHFFRQFDQILTKNEQKISKKQQIIKSELSDQYKFIASQEVQRTFTEAYGNNYNANSLQDSLIFNRSGDARPDFNYNEKKLTFSKDLKEYARPFNECAIKPYDYGREIQNSEFYTVQGLVIYGDSESKQAAKDKMDKIEKEIDKDSESGNNLSKLHEESRKESNEQITEKKSLDYEGWRPANMRGIDGGYAPMNHVYQIAKGRARDTFTKYKAGFEKEIKKRYGFDLK